MSNCWCTGASSSCKSTSSMREALADFDVVRSKNLWENTNLCLVEHSIDREPWSDCGDIFAVLSDLELQPASPDGHSLKNLAECIFPEHELPDPSMLGSSHGDRKAETSFQYHTAGWPKGIHEKQSKGKQAQETTKQNCLPEECNLNDVIEKKRCSERRRRKRINAKLTSLRQLLPNSSKRDQATILEDAIKYIQSLKLQLDVVFKSSGQNQIQTIYLPQPHASVMNPAFGIGAAQQFVAPCSYGSMVTPEFIQLASIPQRHAVLCHPHYFTTDLFPLPFESTEHR